MNRFLLLAVVALLFVPLPSAAFSFDCINFGSTISCNDYSLPDVKPSQPIQVPNNTSGEDSLKAMYGLTDYYACVRETNYLDHSGGPSSGVYYQLLKHCLERKAMYGGDIQLQKVQIPQQQSCPIGTYAQNGVCIQTVIQQAPAAEPVQDNASICRNDYGPYSVWTGEWNDDGGPVCGCASGYDWQGDVCAPVVHAPVYEQPVYQAIDTCPAGTTYDGSSCVGHDQRCKDYYGALSEWGGEMNSDGGPVCTCPTGFEWNEANTACRAVIQPLGPAGGTQQEEPKSRGWFTRLLDWLTPW